jgi:hypothetical protein
MADTDREALSKLRVELVEKRRQEVLRDVVNEKVDVRGKRVADIQNIISAIDAAIADEPMGPDAFLAAQKRL